MNLRSKPLLPVGTRSLLYGVHAFWLHPFAVGFAWWRLYGFPRDWKLYICFIVHDWGYWGCDSMDSFEGRLHPQVGAEIARRLLGEEYAELVLLHSRHYAKLLGKGPSRLCAPDKLASTVLPAWLYLTLATLSGEIEEYMREENTAVLQQRTGIRVHDRWTWFAALKGYLEQETRRTAA